MKILKSFIAHTVWFNRKSQHYMFGNWTCYVKDTAGLFKYYRYYPLAYCKFMWLCRYNILKGKEL